MQQTRTTSRSGNAAGRDVSSVIRIGVVRGDLIVNEQASLDALARVQRQMLETLVDIKTEMFRRKGKR